jgi:hypothetical protein
MNGNVVRASRRFTFWASVPVSMISTKNWWVREVDWATPAGELLQKFLASLPKQRPFHLTLYGLAFFRILT